ncbi:uncharacterized protein LOC128682922 [Plodia interpunctella]|uniref:uncharacterized protein LOC128682922 n=1 Tax=Plodia interpunctella TaxID=58824 RepID=UPI002367D99D|nr:uncharacterized protein LOC128682922 [Plodia interpunctella]
MARTSLHNSTGVLKHWRQSVTIFAIRALYCSLRKWVRKTRDERHLWHCKKSKKMTNKWILMALCALTKISTASITGVTYRDNFDFEERYYNPNECNPFYWHPLHLPEDCAELLSKAIRKKAYGPVRFMMTKPIYVPRQPPVSNHQSRSRTRCSPDESDDGIDGCNPIIIPKFESEIYQIDDYYPRRRNPLSPYEQMLENLREDISYLPTAPKIAPVPGYGPVAFYQQPISKTSKNMILEIAKIYGKYSRRQQNSYSYPYPQYETILKVEEKDTNGDKNKENVEIV